MRFSEADILKDCTIQTTGGHGPGGQHMNATDSAVRMRHQPTGIEVFINGRKQLQNKTKAIRMLTAKVNDLFSLKHKNQHQEKVRHQFDGGHRSNKIRTYDFIRGKVKDHRLKKTGNIKQIMKGKFDIFYK